MAISTIDEINIKNFFSIKELYLTDLKNKKEIYIVGENGDGKTLLLQAISLGIMRIQEGLVFDLIKLQKNIFISITTDNNKNIITEEYGFCSINTNILSDYAFFAYGASRNNHCQIKEDSTGYLTLFSGEYESNPPDIFSIQILL